MLDDPRKRHAVFVGCLWMLLFSMLAGFWVALIVTPVMTLAAYHLEGFLHRRLDRR